MDTSSYLRLVEQDDRVTGLPESTREQLRILYSEGFIEQRDYTALTPEERAAVNDASAREQLNATSWNPVLIKCIDDWFRRSKAYGPQFSSSVGPSGNIPYVLNEFLGRNGDYDDSAKALSVWTDLKRGIRKREAFVPQRLMELRAIMLDYVHTNIVLADRYHCTNYEWDNFQAVFSAKAKRMSTLKLDGASNVPRDFLRVVLPYDFPNLEMKSVVKLLKDPRIHVVREVISALADRRVKVDEALKNDFMRALIEHGLEAEKERRLSQRIRPLKIMLGLAPAHTTAIELGKVVAETLLDESPSFSGDLGIDRNQMAETMFVLTKNLENRDMRYL